MKDKQEKHLFWLIDCLKESLKKDGFESAENTINTLLTSIKIYKKVIK